MKLGIKHGRTDDFCYNIAENPVHLRDLHATMLHILGIDHTRFTYPFRGLDVRLTASKKPMWWKESSRRRVFPKLAFIRVSETLGYRGPSIPHSGALRGT